MIGEDRMNELMDRLAVYVNQELLPLEAREGFTNESALDKKFLKAIWQRSRELGFYGIHLPKEYGGMDISVTELCQIKEMLARSGSALFLHVLGEMGGPLRVGEIMKFATPEQMERFFLPVIRGEKASCFALSEPNAGSDATGIQASAVKEGEEYVLNGCKQYITMAPIADFAIILAVTDPDRGPGGVSAFLVEADRPGYKLSYPVIRMSGTHFDCSIYLKDCRVPAANLLGKEGAGFLMAMDRINVNRLLHCPTMIGLAQNLLDRSIAHAKNRKQFGRSIGDFQAIQHMLANMAIGIYAGRSMVLAAAAKADKGQDIRKEAAMCKVFCSEKAFEVADLAVQIHGNVGLTKGHPVEVLFRTLRMYRIVVGTSEIQRNTIARALLKESKGLPQNQ